MESKSSDQDDISIFKYQLESGQIIKFPDMKNNLKRSNSLDILTSSRKKITKSQSFSEIYLDILMNTNHVICSSEAESLKPQNILFDKMNNNYDSNENEINEILSDMDKSKLIYKGIELGFNLDKIFKCLKITNNESDEEKFFENLINLSNKSDNALVEFQKDNFVDKNDDEDMVIDQNSNGMHDSFHDDLSKNKSKIEQINRKFKNTINVNQNHENSENFLDDDIEKRNFQSRPNKETLTESSKNEILLHMKNEKSNLRPIVIDGDNVAQSQNKFLVQRIKLVVDYFKERGHVIYVIVSKKDIQEMGNEYLRELEENDQLYCPLSRKLVGKRIDCDYDLYMLQIADHKQGIIVSNKDFKKVLNEGDKFKLIIEERVLMYSFVHDEFIPAPDPLGKSGPNLDNFLLFETIVNQKICPYRKKCTYGTKCKFYHPERISKKQFKTAHQSVVDEALENKRQIEMYKLKLKIDENKNYTVKNDLQEPLSGKVANFLSIHSLNDKQKDLTNQEIKTINLNSQLTLQKEKNTNKVNMQSKIDRLSEKDFVARGKSKVETLSGLQNSFSNKIQKNNTRDFQTPTMKMIDSTRIWNNNNPTKINPIWETSNIVQDTECKDANNSFTYFLGKKSPYFNSLTVNQSVILQKNSETVVEFNQILYKKLCSRLPETKAREVLKAYPNETDEEKLVFFAEDKEFFD